MDEIILELLAVSQCASHTPSGWSRLPAQLTMGRVFQALEPELKTYKYSDKKDDHPWLVGHKPVFLGWLVLDSYHT
eukprot:13322382-Ditylum_brightwellii.AAC.1